MRVLYPLAAACLLGAAIPTSLLAAQGPAPARKSGWWEMNIQMSAPMQMTHKSNICVDASRDADALQGQPPPQRGSDRMDCKTGPVGRNAQGWTFSNTCSMQGMTMTTTGVASGDFQGAYRVETTTRMSPAPMPQMAETKTVVVGKFMGPCPAGRQPGSVW
jgi:hypothetical protein